jgi:hypothetical protein
MLPSEERLLDRLCRIYGVMLLAYPSGFRREYSREMVVVFRTSARDVVRTEGGWGLLPFMLRIILDWLHTTLQESTNMATYTRQLRWFAALPLAMLAGYAVQRMVGRDFYPEHQHDPLVRVSTDAALFLMSAAFVSVGVWVAPDRKDSVARIALSVVVVGGAWSMAMGAVSRAMTPLWWGICILLGGAVAYLLWRRRQPSPVPSHT